MKQQELDQQEYQRQLKERQQQMIRQQQQARQPTGVAQSSTTSFQNLNPSSANRTNENSRTASNLSTPEASRINKKQIVVNDPNVNHKDVCSFFI